MKRIICLFFGHKYSLAQKLTDHSRRICCTRCRQSFAMNDDVRAVLPWDASFHRLYESQGVTIEYQPWEFSGSPIKAQGEQP